MDQLQQLKSYKMLIDIVKKTTSALNSDEILYSILEGLISVFSNVEVGILYLYDNSVDLLKMECSYNIEFESSYPFLKIGEGVSGKAYAMDKSVILNGKDVFRSFIDQPSTYMSSFEDTEHQYPYSAMSCLLNIGNQKIGVVTIYNYSDENYSFDNDDMELLKAAADHAGIVIQQARLMKQKDQSLRLLEENNNTLNNIILIQSELNGIMVNGKGFSEILKCLEKHLYFGVVFSDGFFQLISSSQEDYSFDIPEAFMNEGILKGFTTRKDKTIKYESAGTNWIFVPVIGKGKLLGFLVSSISGRRFNKEEESILNYAAIVIAMEWLKKETDFISLIGFINQFVDKMLQDKLDDQLIDWAHKLGFKSTDHFKVLMFKKHFDTATEIYDLEELKALYVKKLNRILQNNHLNGIVFFRGDLLCIIINSDIENLLKSHHIDEFIDELLEFDKVIYVAKSCIKNSIDTLKEGYVEAKECLQMMRISHLKVRVMGYEYLGIWQLLLKLDKNELMIFAKRYLGRLADQTSTKEQDLLATLTSYVENNQHIKRVAEQINLHPNTVYFRIKKIEEMLNIDLTDNYTYLNIQISCAIINHLR